MKIEFEVQDGKLLGSVDGEEPTGFAVGDPDLMIHVTEFVAEAVEPMLPATEVVVSS